MNKVQRNWLMDWSFTQKLCLSFYNMLNVGLVYSLFFAFFFPFYLSFFPSLFGGENVDKLGELVDSSLSATAHEISSRKPLIYWEDLFETKLKTDRLNWTTTLISFTVFHIDTPPPAPSLFWIGVLEHILELKGWWLHWFILHHCWSKNEINPPSPPTPHVTNLCFHP